MKKFNFIISETMERRLSSRPVPSLSNINN